MCIYIYIYTYVCVCKQLYIYIYTYTYIYTSNPSSGAANGGGYSLVHYGYMALRIHVLHIFTDTTIYITRNTYLILNTCLYIYTTMYTYLRILQENKCITDTWHSPNMPPFYVVP